MLAHIVQSSELSLMALHIAIDSSIRLPVLVESLTVLLYRAVLFSAMAYLALSFVSFAPSRNILN